MSLGAQYVDLRVQRRRRAGGPGGGLCGLGRAEGLGALGAEGRECGAAGGTGRGQAECGSACWGPGGVPVVRRFAVGGGLEEAGAFVFYFGAFLQYQRDHLHLIVGQGLSLSECIGF